MSRIVLSIPTSLDALGRVIDVMRRAKVTVREMRVEADTVLYNVTMRLEGDPDEIRWLVAKLDRLPEVVRIEEKDELKEMPT